MNQQELRDMVAAVRAGRVSRRAFVRRMIGLGLTAPFASHLLAHAGLAQAPTPAGYKPTKAGVGCHPTIFDLRDLGGENRNQVTVGIPSRERLVEDTRSLLILAAHSKRRVEQGRGLPEQHLERATAAYLFKIVR